MNNQARVFVATVTWNFFVRGFYALFLFYSALYCNGNKSHGSILSVRALCSNSN